MVGTILLTSSFYICFDSLSSKIKSADPILNENE